MWKAGRADIKTGKVDADPVPTATSLRWGVSVVATIKSPLAATLKALADDCRRLCGDNHTFYNRTNLHATVRSCEFYRVDVDEDDAAVSSYETVLAEVCREHNPFEIAYCGLNANRTGVICQGYPLAETLQSVREVLHRRLAELGRQRGPEGDGVRRTAHASIAVFGGAVADPTALYRWVKTNRETWYGVEQITHLSLVKYDRTAYGVNLVPFAEFFLGKRS